MSRTAWPTLTMLLVSAGAIYGNTIYTYTGNDFTFATSPYTTSDFISFSMVLSAPLGDNLIYDTSVIPLSFTISDGNGVADSSAPDTSFAFDTDSAGNITKWHFNIILSDGTGFDSIDGYGPPTGPPSDMILGPMYSQAENNTPGSWSQSSTVPEPSYVGMMIGAFLWVGIKGCLQNS